VKYLQGMQHSSKMEQCRAPVLRGLVAARAAVACQNQGCATQSRLLMHMPSQNRAGDALAGVQWAADACKDKAGALA
jgi:hypothetical protein